MARIRVLELPMQHVGDVSQTPFAIVIDQVEVEEARGFGDQAVPAAAELTQHEADQIAARIGAVGVILTACTLEVD